MTARYAGNTEISSEKSRAEIERTLTRYGATSFAYGTRGGEAMIAFEMVNRRIVFLLPLPERCSEEFRLTPSRKWTRSESEQEKAYEQAVRTRWRALLLVIKAKLEAVDTGITTIEDEFLAHTVMVNGQTVRD